MEWGDETGRDSRLERFISLNSTDQTVLKRCERFSLKMCLIQRDFGGNWKLTSGKQRLLKSFWWWVPLKNFYWKVFPKIFSGYHRLPSICWCSRNAWAKFRPDSSNSLNPKKFDRLHAQCTWSGGAHWAWSLLSKLQNKLIKPLSAFSIQNSDSWVDQKSWSIAGLKNCCKACKVYIENCDWDCWVRLVVQQTRLIEEICAARWD